jgi:hypothetical protein
MRASTRPRRPLARVPAPVEERENPSDATTVLIAVGALGIMAFVGYELLKQNGGLSPSSGSQLGQTIGNTIGNAIGSAVGSAIPSAAGSAASSLWLGGHSMCDFITFWRQAGSPRVSLFGFNLPFGSASPSDWGAFRSWMIWSNQWDPGASPGADVASCW